MNTTEQDMNRPSGTAGGQQGTGTDQVRDEAARLAQQAREEGKARVDEYRGTAADKVDQLAEGVRAAASELDGDEGLGDLSRHINDLAGGMSKLSQGLREKSADELLRDVKRLAQDNPALFLAGGVALGFALTRLLRASTEAAHAQDDQSGHDDHGSHGGHGRVR